MTRDELIEKLKGYEWRDIEFKEAKWAVPRDVYTTVSAFSNTEGGHLVFGIKEEGNHFEIIGVVDVDKVQNEFLNMIRGGNKISAFIAVQESKIDDNNGTVLIFYIPEAKRKDKPVHLDGNFRESYVRRGGSDHHCDQDEIRRFIRDAADQTHDSEPIPDLDPEHCFDKEVVKWYRGIFNQKKPGRTETMADVEFLNEWGFVIELGDKLVSTRAAILLFGQGKCVRQILHRPVVDFQRIDFPFDEWSPTVRWHDRVTVEENLIRAWWALVDRYMKLADRPFSLDGTTLRRDDDPPDYVSFREAAINLLIHQDFGDQTRVPIIQLFRDRTIFWNPGDAFSTRDELLDATAKQVRNPSIVGAFRNIGLSDQAGSGIRSIFKNWHELGNIPPFINNDKAEKTFGLIMRKEKLLSEAQLLLQAKLGVHLTDLQAQAFALACHEGNISLTDVRATTGVSGREAREILLHLATQVLLKPLDEKKSIFTLADHLRGTLLSLGKSDGQPGNLSTVQVPVGNTDLYTAQIEPLKTLSETQRRIIAFCDVPRSLSEIMGNLSLTHRGFFMQKHLGPLLKGGVIRMTNPENPTAANQKYVLSSTGVELNVQYHKEKENNGRDGEEG